MYRIWFVFGIYEKKNRGMDLNRGIAKDLLACSPNKPPANLLILVRRTFLALTTIPVDNFAKSKKGKDLTPYRTKADF